MDEEGGENGISDRKENGLPPMYYSPVLREGTAGSHLAAFSLVCSL